jgi:hypothetical protein
MPSYRTAQGKSLDMAALAARNERTRAVGNMSVNARGDTIDAKGKVIVPVTQRASQAYQKTVSSRAVNNIAKNTTPAAVDRAEEEFTADDLGFDDDDSVEIEQIKAQQAAPPASKKTK